VKRQVWLRVLCSDAPKPCLPPKPCPPVELRPPSIGFSQVEKLIRDPYSIYAQSVLGLKALDPLIYAPDKRDEGTILHAVFARFVVDKVDIADPNAPEILNQFANEHFDELNLSAEIRAFWQPRFDEIAKGFLEWQAKYSQEITSSHAEINGKWPVLEGFEISGRADRMDITHDGYLRVLD